MPKQRNTEVDIKTQGYLFINPLFVIGLKITYRKVQAKSNTLLRTKRAIIF